MTIVMMLHGYNHDDRRKKHSPFRKGGNYDMWPKIARELEWIPVPWYSAVQGNLVDIGRAWGSGCSNTYSYAYKKLAPAAVDLLINRVQAIEATANTPVTIFSHSLGTRVALLAAHKAPKMFKRILMMNGAQGFEEAREIINDTPQVHYLNCAVNADNVLRFAGSKGGTRDCIGNGVPPGMRRRHNFNEIRLDDPEDQHHFADSHGWKLRGDNPKSFGDHNYGHAWHGNHKMILRFLSGGGIDF